MFTKKLLAVSLVSTSMLLNLTGCNISQLWSSPPAPPPPEQVSASGQTISSQDDTQAKKLIEDYFTQIYSNPSDYYPNNVTGNIPDKLKPFFADRVIKETNGNPENGIHYPRVLSINGLYIVKYGLDKNVLDVGDSKWMQESFISKDDKSFTYYVKVPLFAQCLDEKTFNSYYKSNGDGTYGYTTNPNDNILEKIRILAKYEVTLTKENNKMKILTAKEASIKKGSSRRMSVYNNDFIERLPYLFIDSTVNGKYKVIDADKKLYENEKKYAQAIFSEMSGIDRVRTNILETSWNKDGNTVSATLDKFDLPKSDGVKKKITELLMLDGSYKTRYDFGSFPLQPEMEKINSISNISVEPHASYSDKKKRYIVTFDAAVKLSNGIEEAVKYRYSYDVLLEGSGDSIKVSKFSLNEYFKI
ncbi:MAG TPA: hypothetical protein VF941_15620 [Clostridia bacterium]